MWLEVRRVLFRSWHIHKWETAHYTRAVQSWPVYIGPPETYSTPAPPPLIGIEDIFQYYLNKSKYTHKLCLVYLNNIFKCILNCFMHVHFNTFSCVFHNIKILLLLTLLSPDLTLFFFGWGALCALNLCHVDTSPLVTPY